MDGTTRMVSSPANILPKTTTPTTNVTPQTLVKVNTPTQHILPAQTQQKVQIMKGADGKLQVKGLMPGRFTVQLSYT